MKNKRKFIIVLIAVILVETVSGVSRAAPRSEYESYVTSASDRLLELEEYLDNSSSGQYGLLYDLNIIVEYSMYVEYLCNTNSLGLTSKEKEYYRGKYISVVKSFNSSYGKKSSLFTYVKLKSAENTISSVQDSIETNLLINIPNYINKLFKSINKEYTSLSEDNKKNKFLEENKSLLCNIYYVYEIYSDSADTLSNMIPDEEKTAEFVVHKGDSTNGKMEDAIREAVKDYTFLLNQGKQVADESLINDGYEIDLDRPIAENLSDVVYDGSDIQIPVSPTLSLSYLAILASSSVYTPLQSYVGSTEFTESLKSIVPEDSVDDVINLYNQAKDYRKPLYKREVNSNGKATGTAKLITIKDFFEDINNGNTGALVTMTGDFQIDESTQDWIYAQSKSYSITRIQYEDPPSIEDDSTTEDTSTEDNTEENSNESDNNTEDSIGNTGSNNEINSIFDLLLPTTKIVEASEVTEDASDSYSAQIIVEDVDFAYDEMTDETIMTSPVLLYGTKYSRSIDNLTTLLLQNIYKNTYNTSSIQDTDSRFLYVNALGDIVTDNNLVILPGFCNPIIYDDGSKYNPYSVAFMNSYASIITSTNKFQVSSENDIGKLLIMTSSDTSIDYANAFRINSNISVSDSKVLKVPELYTKFYSNSAEQDGMMESKRLIFGGKTKWNNTNNLFEFTPYVMTSDMSVEGISIFPYSITEDEGYLVSKIIAENAYYYLAVDKQTNKAENTGILADNYVLHYIMLSGLGGTNNPAGYADDRYSSLKELESRGFKRFQQIIVDTSSDLVKSIGKIDGVLGIKNFYNNSIFGYIFLQLKDKWLFVLVLMLFVIMVGFVKTSRDRVSSLILSLASAGVIWLFIFVLPTYVPMVFNVVLNNISDDLSYKILGVKSEQRNINVNYEDTVNKDGEYIMNRSSLTLYRIPLKELDSFYDNLNIDASDVNAGNYYVINQNSGLFVEGDQIKINNDLLFSTLEITGKLKDVNGTNVYQLKSNKTVSNNVDYYTPYYQIVDEFIAKLNDLAYVYHLPRKTISYSSGVIKDNYLVYSYVNSSPFLEPGKYGISVPNDSTISNDKIEQYIEEATAMQTLLQTTFGNNVDFLGIADFLYNPTKAMKKTLWMKTLQTQKYYDSKWNPNEEKLDELITYVNYQTKKFIYSNSDQIGNISDDNMIKIIALRALVAMTQKSSDFGNWWYPFSLNYEEFTLTDVLSTSLIDNYNKFISMDLDIIDYVSKEFGWFNVLVVDIVIILFFICITVINLIIPLLYLCLGMFILIRFVKDDDIKPILRGFSKSFIIFMICYTVIIVAFFFASISNGSLISIYSLFIVGVIVTSVIFTVIWSILRNPLEFGSQKVTGDLKATITKIMPTAIPTLKIPKLRKHTNSRINTSLSERSRHVRNRYSYNRDIDTYGSMYDDRYESRNYYRQRGKDKDYSYRDNSYRRNADFYEEDSDDFFGE